MRVLVVEDEPKMAALIRRVLVAERHVVDIAPDGVSAIALAETGPHDVIVLDRMLPDIDGITVLRLLRAKGIALPGAHADGAGQRGRPGGRPGRRRRRLPGQAVRLLRAAGAHPGARAAARCRPDGRMAAGDLVLDELRHVAQVGDRSVDLSAREFALLGFFIRHAGQVVTRQQILDQVWGAEPDVYSNVVDLYVSYLRRKLGELDRAGRLRTVRGVGYTLKAED